MIFLFMFLRFLGLPCSTRNFQRFVFFFEAVSVKVHQFANKNAIAQVMSFYDIAHTWDGDWDDKIEMTR